MLYKKYQNEPAPDEPLEYTEYRLRVGDRTVLWFSPDSCNYWFSCWFCGLVSGNYRGSSEALYTVESHFHLSLLCPRCQQAQLYYRPENVMLYRNQQPQKVF